MWMLYNQLKKREEVKDVLCYSRKKVTLNTVGSLEKFEVLKGFYRYAATRHAARDKNF